MLQHNEHLEPAIIQIMAGASVEQVAESYSVERSMLLALTEEYRAAGRRVLTRAPGRRWHYWRIPLSVPRPTGPMDTVHRKKADDAIARDIGPLCASMVAAGKITHWWFMRKADGMPHIRLRIFGEEPMLSQEVVPHMEQEFARLEQMERIRHWSTLVYESETMVFGGPDGMDLAHDFFFKDSMSLYHWLVVERESPLESLVRKHRPEASLIALHRLLNGAGLDIFEQWDVWIQLKKYRQWNTTATPEQREKNIQSLGKLVWASQSYLRAFFGEEQYAIVERWGDDFAEIGQALAQLNREGKLHRGLRNILASYIIFHWNRMNFNVAMQAELATLAERIHGIRANQSDVLAPRTQSA